jgi:hypothetical protein
MEAQLEVPRDQWKPIAERPCFDEQPIRQFIRVEGKRFHSGINWFRIYYSDAYISKETYWGYCVDDMKRISERGDMEYESMQVTHWMPCIWP